MHQYSSPDRRRCFLAGKAAHVRYSYATSTFAARSLAAWISLTWRGLNRLKRIIPESESCFPKSCRIRKRLGQMYYISPGAGSRSEDAWCGWSVATSCVQAYIFVSVDLLLTRSVSIRSSKLIRACHLSGAWTQAFWLPAHLAISV